MRVMLYPGPLYLGLNLREYGNEYLLVESQVFIYLNMADASNAKFILRYTPSKSRPHVFTPI
jgi:hypothetical protein